MRARAKGIGLGAIAVIAALALPASAGAASYVASPGGTGMGSCPDTNPCSIYTAVTKANMPGDQVLLRNGTFSLNTGGVLTVNQAITIRPQTVGARPTIASTNGNNLAITAAATVQDVTIDISGIGAGNRALDLQAAATGLRVQVIAAGTSPVGVQLRNGALLSDSTVETASASGRAITTGGNLGSPTAKIRNVTAIATGATSVGLETAAANGTPQVVGVHNSILRGTATDMTAIGVAPNDVTINVDHSNFTSTVPPPVTPNAVINDNGGNQSQAPLFANAAGGDFTQLAGSATIDKGAAVGGLGPLDFSLGPRALGLAPDIGADEFPSELPPQFANATESTATTSKCKKGFKLKTVKNKKGKKKKKCVKKKKKKGKKKK